MPIAARIGVSGGTEDKTAPPRGATPSLFSWETQLSTGRTLESSPMRIAVTSAWARLVAPSFW